MNPPLTSAAPVLSPALAAMYEPVAAELAEAEALFRAEMRSRYESVDELARYGVMLGGKRLRPALLLLAGKAAGALKHDHIVLAAVVEMIHTATLVHDDVLDQADLRRHIATVNARWGREASVLLGDYLFTHAFYLASTLKTTYGCRVIGRATNTVCEGELRQVRQRGNLELNERDYLSIIEAKTAALCACCCLLGAKYAGASRDVAKSLARFGRCLGIAFQIADDLLDLVGQEQATGKSLGTDLVQLKLTLPVIRLLAEATPTDREHISSLLRGGEPGARAEILFLAERSGALAYARHRAEHFINRARESLHVLPASPAREVLEQMAWFSVHRPS